MSNIELGITVSPSPVRGYRPEIFGHYLDTTGDFSRRIIFVNIYYQKDLVARELKFVVNTQRQLKLILRKHHTESWVLTGEEKTVYLDMNTKKIRSSSVIKYVEEDLYPDI